MGTPGVVEALASGDLRQALDLTTEEVCRGLTAHAGVLAWLSRARVLFQLGAYAEAREAAAFSRKVAAHGNWQAETCQSYLALAACETAAGDWPRAELALEKAADLARSAPGNRDACVRARLDQLWAQRRLEELRTALAEHPAPCLARLRLEMEEDRWEEAAATWNHLPPPIEPDAALERLLAGARIAHARGLADVSARYRRDAEQMAARWVESLPGARRGPFADRLRALGIDIETESSVTAIPGRLPHPLPPGTALIPETRVIADVIKRMNAELRLQPLLDLILDSALALCGGDFGYLVVVEGERIECRVVRHEHRRPPDPAELAFTRRVAEQVARAGTPLLAVDAQTDTALSQYGDVRESGARAVLSVPMRIQERTIGSIYLHSTTDAGVLDQRGVEIAGILADQAALAIERSLLLARAVRDPLTSLYNHSHFEKQLEAEVERCQRHHRGACLILVDLDQFKSINDTYGHDFGTRVIKEIAGVIEGSLRATDTISRKHREESQRLVARYGGDEFEILLPEANKASGMMIANRLIEKVRKRVFRAGGKDVTVDLSVGVSGFPEDSADAQELFLHADEALYEAKRSGRGCAVAWHPREQNAERTADAELDELLVDPAGRRLLAVLPQILAEGSGLARVLPRALEKIIQAIQGTRGFLFIVATGRAPELSAVWPAGTQVDPGQFDLTSLGHSVQSERPILLRNQLTETGKPRGDSSLAPEIGSSLCLPVMVRDDLRVVFAIERTGGAREFRAQDLPLVAAFARRLSQALRVGAVVERQNDELQRLQAVVSQGLRELERRHEKCGRVGNSDAIRRVSDQIERMAPSPYPVTFLGEPGTEREYAARALHYASPRRQGPFLSVCCSSVPPSLLEEELFGTDGRRVGMIVAAAGGSLFLDDVEALTPALQLRLLHTLLKADPGDARLLAGSSVDLAARVTQGQFHPELSTRLQALCISLPPLRDRRADIPALVEHLLDRHAESTGKPRVSISREALRVLVAAAWPGNVTQLENTLRQACAVADQTIQVRDLPAGLEATSELSRTRIRKALTRAEGSLARAARELGVSRTALLRQMKSQGIEPDSR
ncbi:MAG: diguanylate cyclase [Xanthomonadales bacterium]|nr:diguanylate cyclase [Xanthomonadales bacterium]